MLEELLSLHLLAEVREAVGPLIQIRLVYLEDIAREDHLGAFAGPGDDGLDFMRREVLRFVDYEEHFTERTSPDVCERRDQELLALEQVVYFESLLGTGAEAALDDFKVVHEGLEEGSHFGFLVAREISYVLVAEDNCGAGKDYLIIALFLLKGRCKCQEGLTGACASCEGDQPDVRIETGIECKALLFITRADAVGLMTTHKRNAVAIGVISCGDSLARVIPFKFEQLVGEGPVFGNILPWYAVVLTIGKALNDFGRNVGEEAGFALGAFDMGVLDTVGEVVLGFHAGSLGLQAHVDILGHKGHEAVGMGVTHPHGGGEDAVILRVVVEEILEFRGEWMVGFYLDIAESFAYGYSCVGEGVAVGENVNLAHEVAGIEGEGVVAFFEFVKLLYYRYWDDQVIVFEFAKCVVVVQEDIGVQYKNFGQMVIVFLRHIGIYWF